MKFRIFSDIHLDHSNWQPKPLPEDSDTTLVIAGDLYTGTRSTEIIEWLNNQSFRFKYVIFVMGNHDYWVNRDSSYQWRKIPQDIKQFLLPNVFLLEKSTVTLDGITIGGATLWTDIDSFNPLKVLDARNYTNDFRYIPTLSVREWMQEYIDTIDWINRNPVDILVTHYVPSDKFCHPRYRGMVESCMFNSNTINQLDKLPKTWIFGHTHDNYDEVVMDTRFICNPRGYRYENLDFKEESLHEF
jgi:predicted phosphodiesterase